MDLLLLENDNKNLLLLDNIEYKQTKMHDVRRDIE